MSKIFIISGCNGAGKTTASFTILPELLNITDFVNADEIAKGLSPFQPENVSIEAGRIMLKRLHFLLEQHQDFAFETTLSSKTFIHLIEKAKKLGYSVHLVFYWLESVDLAIERVKIRVAEGGHNIPTETIIRRYYAGLKNLINVYAKSVDSWMIFENSSAEPLPIAKGEKSALITIFDETQWKRINQIAKK